MPVTLALPLVSYFACSMHIQGEGGGRIKLANCINTSEAPCG